MGFGPPGGDDASFIMVSVRVNHRNFQTIDQANGVHPYFVIVKPVIDPFHSRPFKNPHRILKGNPMVFEVSKVLFVRPSVAHNVY